MKHYTIKINNKNSNNGSFNNNASKNLDNLILSNLKKMNPYLENIYDSTNDTYIRISKKNDSILDAMFNEAGFDTGDRIIIPNYDYSDLLKGDFDTEFTKAAKFLSSYTPKKTYYKLYDDNDITFFEDEIQIGNTLIPLYKLSNPKYYRLFTPETKKLIINIFISINR